MGAIDEVKAAFLHIVVLFIIALVVSKNTCLLAEFVREIIVNKEY